MSKFARIYDGFVAEIITLPDGFDVNDCFTPAFVAMLVEITGMVPMPAEGWAYADGVFTDPMTGAQ